LKKTNERGAFIDTIQEWFRQRSKFWALISFVSLSSLISLQLLLILQAETNPYIRQGIDSILVTLLALFVFSIFWRGSIPTFLSLAGAASVYAGMFYVYAKAAGFPTFSPFIIHKYPAARILESIPVTSTANFYFLVGMFALILSIVIALKPSFFHAKGSRFKQPYEVWTSNDYLESSSSVYSRQMVPVDGLLTFTERQLAAKYKYILMVIGGRTYFVSPDDWVPEGSGIIRDKESGSLLGIPKVSDGFNVW
jgi:hypothetical protein